MGINLYTRSILILVFAFSLNHLNGQELQVDSLISESPDTVAIEKPDSIVAPVEIKSTDEKLTISFVSPDNDRWHYIYEGETVNLNIISNTAPGEKLWYYIVEGSELNAHIDSLGHFSWTPSFDLVDRLEKEKKVAMQIEVKDQYDRVASKPVEFTVFHVNRPPVVSDLQNLYVQANTENTYRIEPNLVNDPDNDPIVFRPIPSIMPEGAQLTENGVFTWKPSIRQFNRLKDEPINLSFIVEDQPFKAEARGNFAIMVTQMDLPPEIIMIPNTNKITTKENETVNFKFFLSDPNGDDDIVNLDVVSEDLRLGNKQLIQNSKTQWEFIWMPGYDFVRDGTDSLAFNLTFFVVDKSHLRKEKTIRIKVLNTPNQEQIDKMYYTQYRGSLVRIWDLLQQLEEKEKEYYKKLNKAKKGRTRLAVTDASLGAITGLSPVVVEDQKDQKMITGIGGTTVMTLGTLKAASVIAKSPTEYIQNLNKIIEKKNELLVHGNVYARRYSTITSRRDKDFQKDSENLLSRLLLKDVATLELDAGWKNPKKADDDAIKELFPDFIVDNNL